MIYHTLYPGGSMLGANQNISSPEGLCPSKGLPATTRSCPLVPNADILPQNVVTTVPLGSTVDRDPLGRLMNALPGPLRRVFTRLLRPQAKAVRIPTGILMVLGGLVGFLPIVGFWMLPAGLILLGEDIPSVRRLTLRMLSAVQGWSDRVRAWLQR